MNCPICEQNVWEITNCGDAGITRCVCLNCGTAVEIEGPKEE